MQKNNTVNQATNTKILINNIEKQHVAIVVNIIVSVVEADQFSIMIYNGQTLMHQMKFSLQENETIFLQSKLFLTQGNSIRVKSNQDHTTFTAMYDISINS